MAVEALLGGSWRSVISDGAFAMPASDTQLMVGGGWRTAAPHVPGWHATAPGSAWRPPSAPPAPPPPPSRR
jgi:hypothetical protein